MRLQTQTTRCAVCGTSIRRDDGALRLGRGLLVHKRCAGYRRQRDRRVGRRR